MATISLRKRFRMFTFNTIRRSFSTLSRGEWILLACLTTLLGLITLIMLAKLNSLFLVTVPVRGGVWREGELGSPRFINPVLAFSENDRDITELVYSGLMKKTADGSLVPDLADHYQISDNHLVYTMTLADNLTFHDGAPLTSEDVVFTISKIQDPALASSKRLAWQGVTVTAPDPTTVIFTLTQPYGPFLESLTVGILPAHIWQSISSIDFPLSNYNISPIGEGPYRITNVERNAGIPNSFTLSSFKDFHGEKPYIPTIIIRSFSNEKDLVHALSTGNVDAIHGVSASEAHTLENQGFVVEHTVLPRIFALFFNPSHNQIFTDHALVTAINLGIDKNAIVENVLAGYGRSIESPLPIGSFLNTLPSVEKTRDKRIGEANAILDKAGWVLGADGIRSKTDKKTGTKKLAFSIATGNIPELENAVLQIKSDLSSLGISVTSKIYDLGTLNQTIIGPRNYDALFFGQVVSSGADLYAFWHSSERADPGLNIALYANPKVDGYLTQALASFDGAAAKALYEKAGAQIVADGGAVFIYSPEFLYIHDVGINNLTLDHLVEARDRFLNVSSWYLQTDRVWSIFTHSNNS